MATKGVTRIGRGQAITFRLPSDTPDHIIRQLQILKETERRNFSSRIAQFALEGMNQHLSHERETVTIPLPKQLTKEQRNWLKHSHSEALLGSIVYQLLADPHRATSVLASLNSNAIDIDDALYLQETDSDEYQYVENSRSSGLENEAFEPDTLEKRLRDNKEDDLLNFDLETARKELASTSEDVLDDEEEDADDLLGDFLARMNK